MNTFFFISTSSEAGAGDILLQISTPDKKLQGKQVESCKHKIQLSKLNNVICILLSSRNQF